MSQICGRGKTGARRGRRPEHELQPRTTRERRRGPTGGAPVLPTKVRKVGRTKTRSFVESSEGWRKRAPTRSRRPLSRMIWSGVCWEMVRNKKPLMTTHILMMIVTCCRPGELLQSMREDLIRPMHGEASDKSLLLHPVQRSVPSKTQSYDDNDRPEKKTNLPLDHQSGCSPGGRPSLREDLRVPIRRFHQGVSKGNTNTGTERYRSVSVTPFWSVAGQSGTTPHNAGDQRRRKVGIGHKYCPVRKIWKTGTDPVRSHQKSTHLLRSHRLSSRGGYLWETPSRGRFTTLSWTFFSNHRVGRAAHRLGVRTAFWNPEVWYTSC